jgi:predicted unusual protein kinase regulating ubiquinone biosynthesis (AarF/ABC1/UbiB family)
MILLRQPWRLWQVLSVFALYFGGPRLGLGPYARLAGPVRLRLALARLGGAWVKFGQMLAMRLDLLPTAYCDELFKLLNQMEPFSYDDVRAIISAELGDVPERIFQSFETESFAAASIGQVHRATLHSGEQVAVKVQRPGVRATIRSDVEIMFSVSGLIDRMHLFGATRSRVVIEEFARWTTDELDYLVEARQAALLHENAEGDRSERIARVYPDLTTSRVLTTELIEGIPLLDILRAVRDGDTAVLASLAEAGHDLDRIARHLDWNMLNQVYVFGVFHADLHPANLFVLPGDAIGYVDFGIVGQLSDRLRRSLTRYGWLLFRGDIEAAVGELMRWIAPSTASDVASARWRLERAHQAFVYETLALRPEDPADRELPRGSAADNPYLRLASAVMDTVRDHELTVSGSVVAYLRMLVTLGALRHQLAARYDVVRTARRFFRRMMRQEAISWFDPRLSLERLDAARTRLQRGLDFVDFVESQEQFITAGTTSLFGVRNRLRAARQRLIRLGATTLIVGVVLYFVLADRAGTTALLPDGVPYEWAHAGLAILLVLLIVSLVLHLRQFGSTD